MYCVLDFSHARNLIHKFIWQYYTIAKFLKNIFTVIAVNSYLRFFLKRWTSIIIILAILRSIKHSIYMYNILIIGFSIIGKHFLDSIVKKKLCIGFLTREEFNTQYIVRGQHVLSDTSSGVKMYQWIHHQGWSCTGKCFLTPEIYHQIHSFLFI